MRTRLFFILLSLVSYVGMAQIELEEGSRPTFSERVYFGGGLGLNGGIDSHGYRYFFLGLYPMVGYMVNNEFSIGTAITYQYYSYPDVDQTIHQYGLSPFARYNFGQFFLYTEYMLLNSPTFTSTQRQTFDRLLWGAGFSFPVGKRGSINGMGLYDALWRSGDFAFASPWVFRVFYLF